MIIYKAVNSINNKIYIGLTTRELEKRKIDHYKNSKYRKTRNKFYNSIRKYGWNNFKWSIIDSAESVEELAEKEKYWIKYYNTYKKGLNSSEGGESVPGFKHSESTKNKIRKSQQGEKGSNTTLKESEVIEIKTLLKYSIYSQYKIAEIYNVSRSAIKHIKEGSSWKHIYI